MTPDDLSSQLEENAAYIAQVLSSVSSAAELESLKNKISGKASRIAELRKAIAELPKEERPAAGQLLNKAKEAAEQLMAKRLAELSAKERTGQLESERLDLTEIVSGLKAGHLHPVTHIQRRLEDIFSSMGFQIAEGPEVETEWNNFGALNFPPGHPARDMYDTLYVDHNEPGTTLLRTHTSPVQVRTMTSKKPPIYVVAPGRCFRQDTADTTHMPVFHQIEGLVVDTGITFGDLAGTIEEFIHALFGEEFSTRLRPSYFPFTEPSAEFDVLTPDGNWLELGGSGMVHPNVLKACGIDPEKYSGFAFGFGIDRLAMMTYSIDDLREFWNGDERFLRQF